MAKLSASEARIPPDIFNRVAYGGERIRIEHRSGRAVMLVSEEDLADLEAIEDGLDAKAAREALAEYEASGRKSVPLEEVAKQYNVDLPD